MDSDVVNKHAELIERLEQRVHADLDPHHVRDFFREAIQHLREYDETLERLERAETTIEKDRQWAAFFRSCALSGETPNASLDKAWLTTEMSPMEAVLISDTPSEDES